MPEEVDAFVEEGLSLDFAELESLRADRDVVLKLVLRESILWFEGAGDILEIWRIFVGVQGAVL